MDPKLAPPPAGITHREADVLAGVAEHLDLTRSQSPAGVGRAVVALGTDPGVLSLSGQPLGVDDLAQRYGIDVFG